MRNMLPLTWLVISSALMYHLVEVTSYPNEDLIKSLPGQPPNVTFQQFSGYVTVDEANPRHYFYYFVEAETNPESKPLVLWLNGGPGCSTVGPGGFTEHGPFFPRYGGLIKNNYTWIKEANMLYLDSPAGVGFSYSENYSFFNYVDDAITARDNFQFLQNWLVKFPEYKNRDLFLSGESYAGHYVPTLATLIINSPLKPNLKGIALSNPILEFNTDFNSHGEYLWSQGVISDATFELLQTQCNYSTIVRQQNQKSLSPTCSAVKSQMNSEMGEMLNPYDLSSESCPLLPFQDGVILTKRGKIEFDMCISNKIDKYLNRKEVQEAMHAKLVWVKRWMECNGKKKGMLKYNVNDIEISMVPLLANLTKAGVRVWTFSGDQDSIMTLIGTRKIMSGLASELGLNTTILYRAWLEDGQVGGFTEAYGDGILTFATVRGAGHEPPFFQPARTLVFIRSFLQGSPLPAPPPESE